MLSKLGESSDGDDSDLSVSDQVIIDPLTNLPRLKTRRIRQLSGEPS